MVREFIDLTGQKFGRLTILEYDSKIEYLYSYGKAIHHKWRCQCECGKIVFVRGNDLKNRDTTSCGCYRKEATMNRSTIHGLRYHPIYQHWADMNKRCSSQKFIGFRYYGGKGIKVCDEWNESPGKFIGWAEANGWKQGLTIDRIDSDSDYCPDNCQWITLSENVKRMHEHHKAAHNKAA